ncbi:MAG TPA: hypothetical protein VJH37_00895 [Candidatus Nanoarchaeia archaeon]|nr:hypothetical protein [Candidatus Nanoarchaeia archaeon]
MLRNNVHLPQSELAMSRRFVDTGLSWYDTHTFFAERGGRMPLLGEYFALFSEPLKNSQGIPYSNKRTRLFRTNLLRKREKPRIEWIDALFVYRDSQWYLHQKHTLVGDCFEAQERIPLIDFFHKDGMVALDVLTESGWPSPPPQLSSSRYKVFSLRPKDRHVAVLYIGHQGPQLRCNEPPGYEGTNRGGRPVYSLASPVNLEQRLSPTG